jgi:hypothetical protein
VKNHILTLFILIVVLTSLLAGCANAQPAEPTLAPIPTRTRTPAKPAEVVTPTQTPDPARLPASTPASQGDVYASQVLTASYSSALNVADQLMLGMLRLAGTANAVTSDQAVALLPILRSLQGQSPISDVEWNTALVRVEAQLTLAQLSAIANMHLTQDDLQTWMRDNGQGRFGPGSGGAGPLGTPGAPPAPGGASPAPRGTPPSPGGAPPGEGMGAGPKQGDALLNALIRLLTEQAAEGVALLSG